jgi:hypothetical protein
MRTVWIALFCLISVGAMASLRFAMTPTISADTSPDREKTTSFRQDALVKADKLEAAYVEEVPQKKLVKSIAIVPPAATTTKPVEKVVKIISRHWHAGHDKMTVRPGNRRDVSRARYRS